MDQPTSGAEPADAADGGAEALDRPLPEGVRRRVIALVADAFGGLTVAELPAQLRRDAQQRKEAQDKLGDLADVRKALGENKKKYQGKLADAQRLLNSLTAAGPSGRRSPRRKRRRTAPAAPASERVDLGNEAPASGRGAAALSAAATQLGKPYVSGGSGPNSYDCSGLTQWAFAQAGVGISRTTYTQQNDGTKIGRSQLRPGDLVFFNGLSHVGFYAGNNQILHAPKPGTVVRYESMDYMGTFQFGVRI
ncbi:NlpC/P60 domain-containing protein OS=Streptomyces cyaneofuscatus OX=66883 GN=G3I52_17720 PE=3 SV=1 [Streptomyces cyaneofuscatus]